MNLLSAHEIKKHGVGLIEKQLRHGPVHVLKHNRPIFVILTEKDYQLLSKHSKPSGLLSMLKKPVTGDRLKEDLDKQLNHERDTWES